MLHTILAGSQTTRVKPTFVSSSINSSAGSAITVTAPSGIQNGDLIVAVGFSRAANTTFTPPSGFNTSYVGSGGARTVAISTKIAASESGNYSFTWGVALGNVVSILVYRNATSVNAVGSTTEATSATGTAGSITPTYAGTLCAAFGIITTATISTPPSSFTQRSFLSSNNSLAIYDLENQPAAATSAASLVWSTSANNASVQFQITNEPDVTPTLIATAQTQNAATGSTLVINTPTGTADGDLMVAVMAASGTVTWTGDTSWTEPADQGSSPSLRIAYKTAGASEPSSYTFTASTALQRLSGCILTYRYAAYDTIAGAFTTGADPLILTSISPIASQSKLIAAGARAINSVTLGTPTSMTAQVTDADGTTPSYIVCDQKVSSGPVGTRSMSTGSTTAVAGIMLAIKPTRSL